MDIRKYTTLYSLYSLSGNSLKTQVEWSTQLTVGGLDGRCIVPAAVSVLRVEYAMLFL